MGDALLLALVQYVLAPPAAGPVTGVTVGWMLTGFRWWRWLLLGLAFGLGSAALYIGQVTARCINRCHSGQRAHRMVDFSDVRPVAPTDIALPSPKT